MASVTHHGTIMDDDTVQDGRPEGPPPGAVVAPDAGLRVSRRRTTLFLVLAALGLAAVLGRLAYLQLDRHDHYSGLRERQTRGVMVREQPRMRIAFRNGELAAQSVASESVFVEPPRIADTESSAARLGRALGIPPADIWPLLLDHPDGDPDKTCRFRWLARRIPEETAGRVRALGIPGVSFRTEYLRRYPSGTLAAQILGGVGVDGQGLDGVELAADALLRGVRESERVVQDARRKTIAVSADLSHLPPDGASLVLTLHRGIQWILEEELDRIVSEFHPSWTCAVAMDPATGEVLGMSARPTFDANAFGRAAPDSRRNRCVTDTYEPGSTFKPFVLAADLEEGLARLDETVGCENGAWTVEGRTIHDHHPYGVLSVQDIIAKSSNVGAVKLGLRLVEARGAGVFRRWMESFGFGDETGIPLPGEAPGLLTPLSRWSIYTSTSVPIGLEVAVTPLQMARAYSIFANGGYRVEPRIVRGILDAGGRLTWSPPPTARQRVLRSGTVEQVRQALLAAVETGTGTKARLPGYAVAGKTGTTQRYNPATKRYDGGHLASFAAFAPAEAPRLCVLVVVDEPKGGEYYGGKVACPAAGRLLDRGLRMLEVPPRVEQTAQAADAR
jgi:cell division protein FtsI (penicillin-binding protein 3)